LTFFALAASRCLNAHLPTQPPTIATSPSFRRSISDNHQENSERSIELRKDGSDVAKAAEARLRTSPYSALRNLSCECDDGVLVLHGPLGSYYHKQLAQETVAGIGGVNRVVNEIEVVDYQLGG
jgi:osmotically-inducible protein OsmY